MKRTKKAADHSQEIFWRVPVRLVERNPMPVYKKSPLVGKLLGVISFDIICAMVKSRYIGDGHPTFNRNPFNGYINPYYWVDEFIPYYMEIMGLDRPDGTFTCGRSMCRPEPFHGAGPLFWPWKKTALFWGGWVPSKIEVIKGFWVLNFFP